PGPQHQRVPGLGGAGGDLLAPGPDPDPRGVPGRHRRGQRARRRDLPLHELRPDRGIPPGGRDGHGGLIRPAAACADARPRAGRLRVRRRRQAFFCQGMKIVTDTSAAIAISALKARPTMPASRTARLSWRPLNSITVPTISRPVVDSAVKIAAEAATPNAAPSEDAIL